MYLKKQIHWNAYNLALQDCIYPQIFYFNRIPNNSGDSAKYLPFRHLFTKRIQRVFSRSSESGHLRWIELNFIFLQYGTIRKVRSNSLWFHTSVNKGNLPKDHEQSCLQPCCNLYMHDYWRNDMVLSLSMSLCSPWISSSWSLPLCFARLIPMHENALVR